MPQTILLVDDDKIFRAELRDFLDDYNVIEASHGGEALRILKEPNEIDLVILDVMMPGPRGTEVLKEMRRIAPDLGIIILTGYSTKDVAIEALKGHADDYIEKPINIDRTRAIIEKLLEAKSGDGDLDAADLTAKIERVKRFAERNYHKQVTLEDAAAAVCLSPKYLSRIFKQQTGVGFSDYKLDMRIRKSKELLEQTGYTIAQIADKVGYQNAESFISIFKKLAGRTPSDYRARARAKEKKKLSAKEAAKSPKRKKVSP
jgi:two-component system response regulator YesN